MIIGTITTSNYLYKTMVLAKSAKQQMQDCIIVVCLVEEEIPSELDDFKYFDEIVLAKDIGFENFYSFIFQYNIYEGSCACKGQFLKYLLKKYPSKDQFIYLDSDVRVYAPFYNLKNLLNQYSIIFTPHNIFFPESLNEELILRYRDYGLYNAGFIGIKRGLDSEEFLSWWSRRCDKYSYIDFRKGLFLDQKWLDFAQCYFPVHSLKHSGYNVGFWNLDERQFFKNENGEYRINNEQLIFFHFSHVDTHLTYKINELVPSQKKIINKLRLNYLNELKNFKEKFFLDREWSYKYYKNGEKIKSSARINFRNSHLLKDQYPNPFEMDNRAFRNKIN
ncbi:hypothetical protein GGQ84_001330 [Desulfitispora alkaliphila]|uniref:glycosyltransferase n=1 Tax=Desulfitispora alkaliphila TaxID=622674 RepID=UPI003D1D0295